MGNHVQSVHNNIFIVNTLAGRILVNSPPETLKFLLANGIEAPQTILISPDVPIGRYLGSSGFVHKGINYASVEFVLYRNFFFRGGLRTRIITVTDNQAERLRLILKETLEGPEDPSEYFHFRWLQRECESVAYFPPLGRAPKIDDLAEITSLESGGGDLGRVVIELEDKTFLFFEDGVEIANLPAEIIENAFPLHLAPPHPLQRQAITLQFIGSSDGFDPNGITTCFLAYFGTTGQNNASLFDAAAYLRTRLGNLGVSTQQISEVILTHLHEDHLAGLPELLLMGDSRIRLLTSDTIYNALLRVLGAMLNLPKSEVSTLFDYYPLKPGRPLRLDGKEFEAIYAVHSIPTLAVKVNGLYYSGDMRYDEEWFNDLEENGILSPKRVDELVNFPNGATVLVQDIGGGNIHTTLTSSVLHTLAEKTNYLILTHTSTSNHKLPVAQEKISAYVEFAVDGHVSAVGDIHPETKIELAEKLETISACPLYARLPIDHRFKMAQEAEFVSFKAGETVLAEGEPSDGYSYIIHDGLAEVCIDGEWIQSLGRGTSVGERGALKDEDRSATIIAKRDVELLSLSPYMFQPIAQMLGLREAVDRAEWLWNHPAFGHMSWGSLLDLALDFQSRHLRVGECLFEFGKPGYECYLLVSGKVMLINQHMELFGELTEPGEFFGGRAVLFGTPRNASACVSEDSEIWALPGRALLRLQMVYPNVLLHLRAVEGKRHGHPPLISIMRPDTD